jgi:hypothetical protein
MSIEIIQNTCPSCDGEERPLIPHNLCNGTGLINGQSDPACNGTGQVQDDVCGTCNGTYVVDVGILSSDLIDLLNDMNDKINDIKQKVDEL